jgi:hypothetical protein
MKWLRTRLGLLRQRWRERQNQPPEHDTLHGWEKAPVAAVFTAQGLYVFAWYVGQRMPDLVTAALPWLYVIGGVAAWLAIDGAMIATVTGMRAGRRSLWSVAAIFVTAAFGAGLALDLYQALPFEASWLHGGFALTIVCYLMHLSTPRYGERPAQLKAQAAQHDTRAQQAETALKQAEAALTQARNEVTQRDAEIATLRHAADTRAAQGDTETQHARRALAQAEARATRAEAEAAQLRHELEATVLPIGGKGYTVRAAAEALKLDQTTMLRRLRSASPAAVSAAD